MLEDAIGAAQDLKEELAGEVARAREERQLIRRLDAGGLFARAGARASFNGRVARLERDLSAALSRPALALGLEEVTLERLSQKDPGGAGRLARALAEIRALAGALSELDQLNRMLAGRALSCVRGYVDAITPPAAAYDRRGLRASAPALAMVSTEG